MLLALIFDIASPSWWLRLQFSSTAGGDHTIPSQLDARDVSSVHDSSVAWHRALHRLQYSRSGLGRRSQCSLILAANCRSATQTSASSSVLKPPTVYGAAPGSVTSTAYPRSC